MTAEMKEYLTKAGESSQFKRVHLHRIVLDTTALLNMVKHCREVDYKTGA